MRARGEPGDEGLTMPIVKRFYKRGVPIARERNAHVKRWRAFCVATIITSVVSVCSACRVV